MGNVSDKIVDLGHHVSDTATSVSKQVKCLVTAPHKPLPMVDLGDGRSADQLRTAAEIMYNMDTKTCINIGYLGPSNDSKTALINSCRYLADCKPDLGIESPNKTAMQYTHCDPSYKHVRFWDIYDTPGNYTDRCLYGFDALILVTTEILRPSDIDVIRESGCFHPPCGCLIARCGMDRYFDQQFGLEPAPKDAINGKTQHGEIIKEGLRNQLVKNHLDNPTIKDHIYLVSAPGMLAARAVNIDGMKYIWDEFSLLKGILECVSKRRY